MNTGYSRSDEQLREAALPGCGTKRYTIQQNLRARRSKQHAAAAAFIEGCAQLFPRSFELRRGAYVPELIQTRKLQQNVEAAYKCARGCSCIGSHASKCRKFLDAPGRADIPTLAATRRQTQAWKRQLYRERYYF